jgi:hypothetical protein
MRRLTVLFAVLAIVAAACGDDSAGGTSTAAPAAAVTEAPATPATTSPRATTAAPATTVAPTTVATTTAAPAGRGGAECLVGGWEIDADKYVAGLASIAASLSDGDTEASASHVGGTWTFDMNADGTYSTERQDFEIAIESPDGELRMVFSGSEAGTWSVDGDMMSFAATETTGGVDFFLVADGVRIPVPSAPFDVDDARGSGTFTCDDTTLEFTPPESATFSTSLKRR